MVGAAEIEGTPAQLRPDGEPLFEALHCLLVRVVGVVSFAQENVQLGVLRVTREESAQILDGRRGDLVEDHVADLALHARKIGALPRNSSRDTLTCARRGGEEKEYYDHGAESLQSSFFLLKHQSGWSPSYDTASCGAA